MIWECWLWSHSDEGIVSNAADGEAAAVRAVRHVVERWWIERAYEDIASVSVCARCGADLNHKVRITSSSPTSESTFGYVMTRCVGWQRHRLVALVSIHSGHLIFGRFQIRGSVSRAEMRTSLHNGKEIHDSAR